jgi:hypothetical protein
MKPDEQDRISKLLKQAVPPVEADPEPTRDLWPHVLKRLDRNSARVPWFDWALLAGVGVFAAVSPAWIPVILYYL